MLRSTTTVTTDHAARYLSQLCKHFRHKAPVQLDDDGGEIQFDFGTAAINATAESLQMTVQASDLTALTRGESIIGSHLERFAFRENISLEWRRSQPI